MSKFTPGPWLYAHRKTAASNGSHSTEVFTEDGGSGKGVVATCAWYPMPPTESGVIGTYRDANARLIAAAPDLLAVTKLAKQALSACAPPDFEFDNLLDAIDAAIAKAEGAA
jgi:hypothetical protein